ncbi:GNAT family N-acetyltransferase [Nonomuraea sp. SYSU D8015]|uniref:GNAT family N-acetyltransferase n=1 Tax=Nonomuraea sp. SYSU D8015 TaxID=2593644 RepID=UPI00166047BF|nr:GNAT family N-acetyltransferase [Nonomuraea sp. SYSU D8015]
MRVLLTARLALIRWEQRFQEDLIRLSSDERVMRFIGSGTWSRDYAVQRHELAIEQWERRGFGMRAITERDGDAFLGLVSLGDGHTPELEAPVLEIGWWVDPGAWGRGIATEAAAAARDEAFARLGASSLTACFHRDNLRSERIMEKLGMSFAGEVIDRYGQPARMYALTRSAWAPATS